MSKVVLDASAVLAVFYGERGAHDLSEMLSGDGVHALISAVNLSEVLTKLVRDGVAESKAVRLLQGLKLDVQSFGETDAYLASRLYPKVSFAGLSFGDRACLALGQQHKAQVWTADRAWGKLNPSMAVKLVRVSADA